ncbi:hypothetical protein CERSUDRAFT_59664 [Gelatoporia subvermispora B]|uniref:Enoyl reductase (ER) domain-containing protein n=1 Tax=Ceriporiopsis subvermispora (strain B) TaxID=914234 RepID=M2Q4D9_CERS8|nr:hypothetical protein CERSUDRAFT_59664 [Gelatoporia subvermispora B]
MPAEQKVLFLTKKHGKWEVGTAEVSTPGRGQLLIKVKATALNPVERKIQVFGVLVEEYPAILGVDPAGTIEAVGEGVTGFVVGDRVGYFVKDKGIFQQYALAEAAISVNIPKNMTFDQAASIPLALTTAALALFDPSSAELPPSWEESGQGKFAGKPFVIFGGATFVGQYGLAKLSGFSPAITTASPSNANYLCSLGATHVLDRALALDVLLAEVSKITGGTPVELAFGTAPLPSVEFPASVLAPGGTLATVWPVIDDSHRAAAPGKKVVGVIRSTSRDATMYRLLRSSRHCWRAARSRCAGPNRVEILPGGLAGIAAGPKRMQKYMVHIMYFTCRHGASESHRVSCKIRGKNVKYTFLCKKLRQKSTKS